MADFINRETVVKLLRGELVSKYPMSFYTGLLAAADEISKISAADVAPLVHGRWKWDERFKDYACSECNHWDLKIPNYCSNCGAKMDGEENR